MTALPTLLLSLAPLAAPVSTLALAPAQEAQQEVPTATDPPSEPTAAATASLEKVEALRGKLERWLGAVGTSVGEDREIALDQLQRTRDALERELDALIGEEGDETRALALEVIDAEVERLWNEYGALSERLAELRAQREETDEPRALDGEIGDLQTRASSILHRIAGHVSRLETLTDPRAAEARARLVDELASRAETLAARVSLRKAKIDAVEKRIKGAGDEEKAELEAELSVLTERLDTVVDALTSTIQELEGLGETVAPDIKRARLAATGELAVEDVDVGVLLGVVEGWSNSLRETVVEDGPRWAFRIAVFVVVLLAFRTLSKLVRRIVRKGLSSSRLHFSSLLKEFFEGLAAKLVLLLGLLIALSQLGFELGPVLAGLGIAGFVLGFALQETLSNFAAGLMILVYRPFDVGDAVSVAGVTGKVHRMSLVSTAILTFDNQNLIVPNSKIWGDVITNITARDTRRVDMTFGIGYEDDIPRAEEILAEVVKAHPKVLADPEPQIRLSNLGDSSVDFVVRPWARTADYWDVKFDVTRSVKLRFDEEGISIPFPQRDVHIYREDASVEVPRPGGSRSEEPDEASPSLAGKGD